MNKLSDLTEVRVCRLCGGRDVHEVRAGEDDGLSYCPDCRAVEGGDTTEYETPEGELLNEEQAEAWLVTRRKAGDK